MAATDLRGIRLIVDDVEIKAGLAALDGIDRAAAMNEIGGYLVTSTQRRIERETGPDGRPWKKLSPRTANKRIGRRWRGTANMLRVSNRLYNSITYAAETDSLAVGTNVVYAAVQHLGDTIAQPARRQTVYQRYDAKSDTLDPRFRKKKASNFARDVDVAAHTVTIPARPYLGIDDADRVEIHAILADHYRGAVDGARR